MKMQDYKEAVEKKIKMGCGYVLLEKDGKGNQKRTTLTPTKFYGCFAEFWVNRAYRRSYNYVELFEMIQKGALK